MDTMLGRVLGHCELVARIGSGGMGTVYQGVHQALQQTRAVKILRPDLADEPDVVARFRREAMIAAGLRHPNIVLIYDVAEQDGLHYLVMDLLEGGTLRDVIRSSAPLPPERAVELLRPLASALDYAHAHGVIHRDVKPGNVMVSKDNHVTLVDFGIARAAEEARLTRSGTVVGTAEYMAPEAFTSAGSDQNGDRYALGVIAYELLTGHAPFRGNPTAVTYAQVNTPPPSPRSFQPAIPVWTEQALLRQLAKSPAERFPSATAFVDALVTPSARRTGADGPTIPFPRPDLAAGPGSAAGIGPQPAAPPIGVPLAPGSMPLASSSPVSPPPRPTQLPSPPRPHVPEPPDAGTVFHQSVPPAAPPVTDPERTRSNAGRLAAFVLLVLAIVVVGSVLVWQRIDAPASVAQVPAEPTAAPVPTSAPPAATSAPGAGPTTAPATSAPTAPPAKPAVPAAPSASSPPAPGAAPTTAPVPAPALSPAPAAPPTSPPAAASPAPTPAFQTVLDERFANNQRGWPDNRGSTAWLDNGVYHLNARDPGRFVSISAPGIGPLADVVVSGRYKKVGGTPGGGFGLIVRDQGPDPRAGVNQGGRYSVLEVGEGQQWGMWRRETDHWVDLQPFTPSDVVKPPGQENELIARAIGSHLIFIVNGIQLADIADPTLTNGKVGIYVAGDGNIVEAEQFTVRVPR
jgi:serine/threonine-protein kinase